MATHFKGPVVSVNGFEGDFTGDIVGNITGNVTGNVTGDLTGDVTGNVTGNVTGDLTGNVTGDLTGDVTGNVTGNLTGTASAIGADAVATAANVADNAISLEHLDSGIEYSHRVFAAGEFTTLGGDASEAITVSGAAATDLAIVNMKVQGAGVRTILTAAAATDAINVVLSGDPSTDHVLTYMLLRAAS
jgi:hypothetical protein